MWPWFKPPQPLAADGSRGLSRSCVRSRPTRLGWGLLAVCVVLWVMAVNYQVNVAYVLVFWLLGAVWVGGLLCRRQLLGLSIAAEAQGECFAGEPLMIRLSAGGRGSRQRWLWLQWPCAEADGAQHWQSWPIAGDQGQCRHWSLPPQPRGRVVLPLLRCASLAPFGVVLCESWWQYQGEAVVYPAPLPHDLPLAPSAGGDAGGRRTAASGDEVAYLQEHQPGASLQQVAWKHYAKSGILLDKRFDDAPASLREDWISYRDYPAHTPREKLAAYLCYRVLQAEQRRQPYVLELPHQTIGSGVGQRTRCLTALGLW